MCLCKIQTEKSCSLPVFMATLSLRGDFTLPLSSSRGNSQNKAPCFAFAENEKHRTGPGAQACDAWKSIFCLQRVGEFASKPKAKEPVRSRAGGRSRELTDNFSLFPDSASTPGRRFCSVSGAQQQLWTWHFSTEQGEGGSCSDRAVERAGSPGLVNNY